jgi:formylglycine-generating enzyme required for sulfatase activity
MDYLQTLEFQMAAMQRKIRLLQDLRFFIETAGPDELAGFGDELRSVVTSSGISVGSVVAALLGAPGGPAAPPGARAVSLAAARSPNAAVIPAAALSTAAVTAASPPGAGRPPAAPSVPVAAEIPVVAAAAAPAAPASPEPDAAATADALALIDPTMKAVPAGSFVMGSDANDAEKPAHKVTLNPYRISDHLVTNSEYALFVEANPQWSKDRADPDLRDESYLSDWGDAGYPEGKADNPVAFVSHHAALAFAAWLGKRLPTEAEWECAARGGLVGKKYPNGDQMNDKIANLAKQHRSTTPVRKFEPNGFGLYDMAGNLFEWTADWYGPYSPGEARNPTGAPEGEYKVVRGGSWMSGANALRVSARVDMEPQTCGQVGIRLVDGL